ncbi:MAG: hypothetical protein O9284_00545 [Steroidobacteraceae bacterium]|jgi:hypothetical protein|nr:hypothetical protein [Steroidobacteraceae bacterium]
MPTDTRRLVIRPQGPRRTLALYAGFALAALLLLWGVFEAGRASAGFSVASWYAERSALVERAESLQAQVAELEARVAGAEIAKRVDREAYSQVEKSLADLQAQLGEQSQELAFYRGIVSPADGSAGLRVQRLLVVPGEKPSHFRLRIVLIQAARGDARIAGRVELLVEGARAGRPASLPLDAIAQDARSKSLEFSFRYFQEVEAEVVLPADFVPQRVQVEVRPRNADAPVRQTYPWNIATA